jgi:excisionase family DNA binding protein
VPDTTFEPLLLTDREAAALCGLGRSTWHSLQAAGKVPPGLKIGRSRRWRRAELLAWIEAGAPDARTWAAMREQQARRNPRVVS